MAASGRILVGTRGWHYESWRGRFYPQDIPSSLMLPYYARRFPAIEIDSASDGIPDRATVESWRDASPRGFRFALTSKEIAPARKLEGGRQELDRLLESLSPLGSKLGPILFELPDGWKAAPERLDAFLAALPQRKGGYAFEFADRSWFSPGVYGVLRRHGAALCIYDLAEWRSPIEVTSRLVYLRLHGPGGPPESGSYDGRTLNGWARRAVAWREEGRDVHVYFSNDAAANAPRDAGRLLQMVERLEAEARQARRRAG